MYFKIIDSKEGQSLRKTLKKDIIFSVKDNFSLDFSRARILAVSDLHLEPGATYFDREMLKKIFSIIERKEVDALIIAGDFIDSLDTFIETSSRAMILDFLSSVGRIVPTVIGVGNHDFSRFGGENRKLTYCPEGFEEYKTCIESLRMREGCQVFLLDDSRVRVNLVNKNGFNQSLEICGLTLSPGYYGFTRESREVLWETLQKKLEKLGTVGAEKILLVHSPAQLDSLSLNYIRSFGYKLVISGHLHNGGVPVWLDTVFSKSERGIIGAFGAFFPARARNTEFRSRGTLLTLGATKMIPEKNHHRFFKFFSANFPPDFRILTFD